MTVGSMRSNLRMLRPIPTWHWRTVCRSPSIRGLRWRLLEPDDHSFLRTLPRHENLLPPHVSSLAKESGFFSGVSAS